MNGREIGRQIPHYKLMAESCKSWIKTFKYKISAFFSFWTQQPVAARPFDENIKDRPAVLVGGRGGRWIQLYMRNSTREQRYSFATSILQSKKGMVRPTKDILEESRKAYVESMTAVVEDVSESKTISTPSGAVKITKERIIKEIKRTVREIYSPVTKKELFDGTFLRDTFIDCFFPSTSANYINNRQKAGVVGTIFDSGVWDEFKRPGGWIIKEEFEEKPIIPLIENNEIIVSVEDFYPQFEEEENPRDILYDQVKDLVDVVRYDPDYSLLEEIFNRAWQKLRKLAFEQPNVAVPVALAEALKVRMITKVDPYRSFVLKVIQRLMHKRLKNLDNFRILGSPTGFQETLADYLNIMMKRGNPFNKYYLSGDYRAATDLLRSWASNAAAEEVCAVFHFSHDIKKLFLDSLTGFEIEVSGDVHHEEFKTQTVGQLMGSITSFPILCIINAALCRHAYELSEVQKFRLRKIPMIINGDDLLMKGDHNLYAIWKEVTELAGLNESVGKTYISKDFCQINSTTFLVTDHSFTHVPYINIGLAKGMTRSGDAMSRGSIDDKRKTIGARYRELIKSAPNESKELAHNLFIKYNKKILNSFQLPWYIPEWLGGLGLIGVKQPSELDLRIAQKILFNWAKEQPKKMGVDEPLWNTWQIAEKRLPVPIETEVKNQGTEWYQKDAMMQCINIMFDSKIKLKDILPPNLDKKSKKKGQKKPKSRLSKVLRGKIKHNQKLWKPKGLLPPPIEYEKILYIRKYKSWLGDHPSERVL